MAKKSTSSAPSQPAVKRPILPPKIKTLRDLPSIIFKRFSRAYGDPEDPELFVDFFWKRVSIYRHPFIRQFSRQYPVQLCRLDVASAHTMVWIGYTEGYLSDSVCVFICERSANLERLQSALAPILVVEAGHVVPIQDESVDFLISEDSDYQKIPQPLMRSMKPRRIVNLQREILSEYQRLSETLARARPRRNPLFD